MKSFFILSFWLLIFGIISIGDTFSQAGARIFDNEGKAIFTVDEGKISDTSGNYLYNARGNIIFRGNSLQNEDIVYLLKSSDLFSKESGYIYNPTTTKVIFSIKKGKFYFGEGRYHENLAFYFEQKSEKQIEMFSGKTNEKIGVIFGGPLQNSELAITFLSCLHYFGIDTLFSPSIDIDSYLFDTKLQGVMHLTWSNGFYSEWIWDGRLLRPKWGNRPEDEWIFDGKYLRPYWGTAVQEEWVWENNILKPSWQEIPELTFIWDGSSIKPYWDYKNEQDWVLNESSARPKWNNDYRLEWTIEGDFPIPLVALIVLGLADR